MAADKSQTVANHGIDRFFASREERAEVINSIRNKQNEEERREIRERYRKFQDELAEQVQEVINPSNEDDLLFEKLQTVDKLFKPVQNTREAALDSASLVNISELGKKKAQALKTDFLRFNAADFCDKVRIKLPNGINKIENYGLSHEDWVNLGQAVDPFFRRTPVLTFMCGAFARDASPKKKRPVKEKEIESASSSKVTKPTQLSSFEETERGELTTAQVEHLLKTLWRFYEANQKQPICFFEFITNPESYGQTVENIFYASFLVRDGHANVFLDDDDLPVIEPLQKEQIQAAGGAHHSKEKKQVVMTLTPAEWSEIVKKFKIEIPLIQPMKEQQQSVLRESNLTNHSPLNANTENEGKGKGKGKGNRILS